MTLVGLIPYILIVFAGLALVAISVLGTGLFLQVGHKLRREPLPLVFWLIGLVIILGPIQSGRNLSGIGALFVADADNFTNTLWINRLVSITILAIALERILRFFVRKESLPRHGLWLLSALVVYSLSNHFINSLFGTRPGFSHQAIYPLVTMAAATLATQQDPQRALHAARNVIFAILLLSAAALATHSELVLQRGYIGGFMPVRYWGLGPHANVLSPLIVTFIALTLVYPFSRRWVQVFSLLLAFTSLVATQSKTAFVACTIVLGILGYYRYQRTATVGRIGDSAMLPALLIGGVMLGAAGLLVAVVGFDAEDRVLRFLGSDSGAQLTSLTNRDQIWAHALREWRENSMFGYGPGIFDAAYRIEIGLSMAFHAHNQAMQSLGAGGSIGLAGLVVYFGVLAIYAFRARAASHGLSLALFALVATRSITETPLTLRAASTSEYLIHLALFIVCVHFAGVADTQRRASAGWSPKVARPAELAR